MSILCVPLGILLLLGGPIARVLFRQPEAIVKVKFLVLFDAISISD